METPKNTVISGLMGKKKRAACAQMTAGDDLTSNLKECRRLSALAAAQEADLLLLPECFPFLGRHERDKFAAAEALDPKNPGPILCTLQEIAQQHQMWVVAGGLPEALTGENRETHTYNTAVVLDSAGEIVASYRKLHLFDVDIPGGATLKESDATMGGSEAKVVSTPIGKVGLSICYDLRFPELYRKLVCEMGAEILVIPAAFTAHTGAAHWHTLLRARAIENQAYVLAAGQWGKHNEKRESYGHSMIVDPWGRIVAEHGDGCGVVVSEIDLASLAKTRQQMPCLSHRKII